MRVYIIIAMLLGVGNCAIINQVTTATSCQAIDPNDVSTNCIVDHMTEQIQTLSTNFDALTAKLNTLESKLDTLLATHGGSQTPAPAPPPAGPPPQNCNDVHAAGHTTDGVYMLYDANGAVSMQAYCELDAATPGGPGWTVFQRRQDGTVSFSRNWDEYSAGFGDASGEFWLGNENLNKLTGGSTVYELRVDMESFSGNHKYARYASFIVNGATDNYRLADLGAYSGTAGDSLSRVTGYYFSTADRDNDADDYTNCAQRYNQAGFWYRNCGNAYLNNPYNHGATVSESFKGILWKTFNNNNKSSLKATTMKIRAVV